MQESRDLTSMSASSVLIGAGQIVALACQFLTGIIVVRIITPEQFGLLSLALTLAGMFVVVTNFGMGLGLPRTIAQQGASEETNGLVGHTITSALFFSAFLGVTCTLAVFLGADKLADLFDKNGLADVLRLICLTIPPLAVINVLAGIFRGLEETRPTVIFTNISLNVIKIFFIGIVLLAGLEFKGVIAANVLTAWITFFLFTNYAFRNLHNRFNFSLASKNLKELVQFSFPLLGVQLLSQLVTWLTILLLSYFHSAQEVGLFAAPMRLVVLLSMPLQAVAYLYLPIATRTIAQQGETNLVGLYCIVTKWIGILTLPMALLMIVDANFIVPALFGPKYVSSAPILVILAFGYSIHSLLGPNGMTLIALGRKNSVLAGSAIAGLTATLSGLYLIPRWGALAGAAAVCGGLVMSNFYLSFCLYKASGIHTWHIKTLRPVFFIFFLAGALYWATHFFEKMPITLHLFVYTVFVTLSLLSPLLTRSITEEERVMVQGLSSVIRMPPVILRIIYFFTRRNM